MDYGYLPPELCRDGVLFLSSADSTNSYIKNMDRIPDGLLVVAETQTAGRGRRGKSFVSPAGGVYMSYARVFDRKPEDVASVTALAAVAVAKAIDRVCGVSCGIKWINDLCLNGKKLCGILTELVIQDGKSCVITGIGINVNTPRESFPPELFDTAGSLLTETGKYTDRGRLALAVYEELSRLGEGSDFLDEYRKRCITVGRRITVTDGNEKYPALALSVTDGYLLKIRTDDGEVRELFSGQVSSHLDAKAEK